MWKCLISWFLKKETSDNKIFFLRLKLEVVDIRNSTPREFAYIWQSESEEWSSQ